jgi:hypothetical protein
MADKQFPSISNAIEQPLSQPEPLLPRSPTLSPPQPEQRTNHISNIIQNSDTLSSSSPRNEVPENDNNMSHNGSASAEKKGPPSSSKSNSNGGDIANDENNNLLSGNNQRNSIARLAKKPWTPTITVDEDDSDEDIQPKVPTTHTSGKRHNLRNDRKGYNSDNEPLLEALGNDMMNIDLKKRKIKSRKIQKKEKTKQRSDERDRKRRDSRESKRMSDEEQGDDEPPSKSPQSLPGQPVTLPPITTLDSDSDDLQELPELADCLAEAHAVSIKPNTYTATGLECDEASKVVAAVLALCEKDRSIFLNLPFGLMVSLIRWL